jgi:hypothetical protein
MVTTTNARSTASVPTPPSGTKNWSTTATVVIASEPPIQIGDSTQ